MPAGGGKSAVTHTHLKMIIWACTHTFRNLNAEIKLDRHTWRRIEMNQLASDRHQCDKEGIEGGGQGASHVSEYINVVSVRQENATEAPSHSDTFFLEAEVAGGKSIPT